MIARRRQLVFGISFLVLAAGVPPISPGQDLNASSIIPTVHFNDTNPVAGGGTRNIWDVLAGESQAAPCGDANTDLLWTLRPADNRGDVIDICSRASNATNSLVVDLAGDISLADGAVFVDRSRNRVGIGMTTPSESLHIVDRTPSIRLDTPDGNGNWVLESDDAVGHLRIVNLRAGAVPLSISNWAPSGSLIFAETGVSIGGFYGPFGPEASLHVATGDGTSKILVSEDSAPTAARRMLELRNSGLTGFRMTNTAGPYPWDFFATVQSFEIAEVGDGDGAEFRIRSNGNLEIIGSLISGGPSCSGGCDALFSSPGAVEPIETHAVSMWEAGHLPGVGPTAPHEPIDVSEKIGGLLNELEKAHIYIEQLHEGAARREQKVVALETRNAQLSARVDRLEALLEKLLR